MSTDIFAESAQAALDAQDEAMYAPVPMDKPDTSKRPKRASHKTSKPTTSARKADTAPGEYHVKPANERRDCKVLVGFTPSERELLELIKTAEERPLTQVIVRAVKEYYKNHYQA